MTIHKGLAILADGHNLTSLHATKTATIILVLVERMMDLHERLATAKAPDDKTKLQRQIDATDCEIDWLVYGLYRLQAPVFFPAWLADLLLLRLLDQRVKRQ